MALYSRLTLLISVAQDSRSHLNFCSYSNSFLCSCSFWTTNCLSCQFWQQTNWKLKLWAVDEKVCIWYMHPILYQVVVGDGCFCLHTLCWPRVKGYWKCLCPRGTAELVNQSYRTNTHCENNVLDRTMNLNTYSKAFSVLRIGSHCSPLLEVSK